MPPVRLITKIVVTYRTSTGSTENLEIEHEGGGEDVDGIVLSAELMNKLAYMENGRCRVPDKRPGEGGWRVRGRSGTARDNGGSEPSATDTGAESETTLNATASGGGTCIWLHDNGCSWLQYCDT
jgi:hypothetical protein